MQKSVLRQHYALSAPPANRVVLIRCENMDALKKWRDGGGRDIQEKVGTKYATFRLFAIDGVEAK